MIASIATLGGYSAIDTLKDSTKLAAKNALKKAAEEGVEVAGKKVTDWDSLRNARLPSSRSAMQRFANCATATRA